MSTPAFPKIPLAAQDPEIALHLEAEFHRQRSTLEMIASENVASEAVMEASGSVFTNKYAEGYPGKRYYHGCAEYDNVETLAIQRACRLFGAEFANVQPHSGTTANQGVFMALVEPGDTVLSLSLAHGGHLSHGHKVNMAGKLYKIVQYGVSRQTELIDFDEVVALAREHRPKMIITGGSAYPRLIDFARFREIADEVGASFLVDMAHFAGLVAGKAIPSPVPIADVTTTTTHKTLRGPRGGLILAREAHGKKINSSVFPGLQGGPLMHQIAAKAVAFGEALKPSFAAYAQQIIANAKVLGEVLVANGMRLVAGGTDTHLVLVDLTPVGVTGKAASDALEEAGITVNMNMIPFDTRKPTECSGVRIGTPVLTSRGMKEAEMRTIGGWIAEVAKNPDDKALVHKVRAQVEELALSFPLRAAEA
ncbi:MAG: serine hydroxymethyltransferase [Candidatus Sumerlaeia bacterium]|nr:serine hydroxymethyltransferase [Candidatus Sumerlaeia bacterium]